MKHDEDTVPNMEHRVGGPGYRWKLAQRSAALQRRFCAQNLDEPTQQASAYLRMYEHVGCERAGQEFSMIAAACTLFRNEQAFQIFKLSILGNLPRAEIAARLGVEQEIVETAEVLFFDIGEMRQASGWMNGFVFVPEAKSGSMDLAAKMKLAHHGGPVITRALIDSQENLPLDEAHQFVDQEMLLHGKLQAALEFDLNANSAAAFIENFLAYDLARQKLQFEREKFQHECEQAREWHSAEEKEQGEVESPNEELREKPRDGHHDDRLASPEPATDTKHVA